jgi:hypothetical protein
MHLEICIKFVFEGLIMLVLAASAEFARVSDKMKAELASLRLDLLKSLHQLEFLRSGTLFGASMRGFILVSRWL